ncbi:GerMN domain-containing protein [Phormidium sp. CLA17]|uniref:GerMN domain-containing protein n=1 Tax=Leptolyngbya sp. Cla-17 TaxID=2803751 RepID=UPI001493030D|nr:GerMN domain-containing protein [Leptolyngbya sp. Cla-17]MBM0743864.1 GerMN domain-containing protein [Leptolyngbya sp. Cla-17]
MQDQQPRRPIPPGIVAAFSAIVLITGGTTAWWAWSSHTPPSINPATIQSSQPGEGKPSAPTSSSNPNAQNPSVNPAPATAEKTAQVYWLKPSDTAIQLAPRPIKVSSSGDANALLETAIQQLLAGSTTANETTTIPTGTQLRSLSIKTDGIHIDLSKEFTRGGGSTSMTGRLAQILYTATSLNPATAVWFSIEGKPLETLGGEGLVLEQPLTRQQFEQDFPM